MDSSTPLRTLRAHLKMVQKSNRGASGYARWINRPVGRTLAAFAYRLGLTPNQLTITSAVLTYAGIVMLAVVQPGPAGAISITLLLSVGFALDAADGQLARLRGGGSPAGEWLDHVVDCVKVSALHLAVLISWFRFFGFENSAVYLIPILYTLQAAVFYFSIMLTEQLRRAEQGITSRSAPKTNEPAPILRSILVLPSDYGLLCWSFLLLMWPLAFTWVYSLLLAVNLIFLLGAWVKWYREMTALGETS